MTLQIATLAGTLGTLLSRLNEKLKNEQATQEQTCFLF